MLPFFSQETLKCASWTETLITPWPDGQLMPEKGGVKKNMGRDGKTEQDRLNQCFHKIICKADGIYQLNQTL